ncbi:hypothetical protein B4U80_07750 [Leptotrombidium deliense]|uniref:Uncharacterized protein n=1 Tax=Leptotrombidium deliense TaxID=299467 RepID=A0A443RJV8_9ACAR|nr:hypothetical protein B4U80_07750 [Leptotrombidium deliense]
MQDKPTENERMDLTEQDVCDALNQMGFVDFVPHLQSCYDDHRKEKNRKQRLKAKQKAKQSTNVVNAANVEPKTHIDVNLDLDPPDSGDDCIIIEDCIDEIHS